MMSTMTTICGYVICLFLALLAGTILWLIWTDKINLSALVSEANGDASMSRLQLLIFTFVIAEGLFMLIERGTGFPDIPQGVLTLLGISASTYAVGKGISYSRDEGVLTDDQIKTATVAKMAPDAQLEAVKTGQAGLEKS
jgi:hypothetical protein